jgi:hypothetical protein
MKPTNISNSEACDPISSNCVIWKGPDLDCINLCKGDTISTVVAKMATELCSLIEQFKIENYDLAALNLDKDPKNINELIQALINSINANPDAIIPVGDVNLSEGDIVYLTQDQITQILQNGGQVEFL